MNRLTNYQSIAIISLFDAENKFDLVNQELAKIKAVIMELKEISHEVANWTKLYGTLLQVHIGKSCSEMPKFNFWLVHSILLC